MQKYFQRFVIALFFGFSFAIVPFCSAKENNFQETNASIPNFNPTSTEINITKEQKDFLSNFDNISRASTEKYGQFGETNMKEVFKNAKTVDSKDAPKEEAIFYFYSQSIPINAIGNLLPQFKKYQQLRPKTKFYIVLNGFPTVDFWQDLRKLYKDEYSNLFKVKIHPKIYEAFELKHVPAWVQASCPEDFRFKQCDLSEAYLVKGNLSLNDFMEKLSGIDKTRADFYRKLIQAK